MLRWAGVGAALLFGIALQTQLYAGQERTASTVLMFVSLAMAWNLIGGFAGYACFGQVGFFGLGGYTTAILMAQAHLSFWVSLPLAAAVAAAFAVAIGIPLLRLKGHYFAVATLGVAEGLRELLTNTPRVTGGGAGSTLPTARPGAAPAW